MDRRALPAVCGDMNNEPEPEPEPTVEVVALQPGDETRVLAPKIKDFFGPA